MRWIFFSLLVANIGFYIWHSMEAEREARYEAMNTLSSGAAAMKGRPLVLVSELSEQEKAELIKQAEKAGTDKTAADLKKPVPEQPQPLDDRQKAVTGAALRQGHEEEQPGSPVSETPGTSQNEESLSPAEQALVTEAGQCLLLGPVSDKQYDQLAQRLLARTIVPERRLIDIEGPLEYWVILPPPGDKMETVRKLQELQGRGIEGQIVPSGKLANAISFEGISSSKAEAETVAEKLHAKGVKVEIVALPGVRQEKWVALSERQTPKLTQAIWQTIKADFPGLQKQVQRCD